MTPSVVIDASVAVKWFMEEPGSEEARRLSLLKLHAPALLLVECGNVLWLKAKTGDYSANDAHVVLRALMESPVSITPDHSLARSALELAVKLGHPIYDCMYLALARELRIPYVTADMRFIKSFRATSPEGMEVLALSETLTLMNHLHQ